VLRHADLIVALILAIPAAPLNSEEPRQQGNLQRLTVAGLPNAIRLHERVISGGEPAGEAAFAALQKLGVRTIISVDGAKPEVELAGRFGLRYVHLPHGYDGIPEGRAAELAKAVRELPGPIYIHCHHGKHRSPAAAAVACVMAGLIDADQAEPLLKMAGTSQHYRGLYASVASASRIDDETLDRLAAEFPPTAAIPPIADAMVQVEHAHEHLKAFADQGWQMLARQPDLDAAHEALLLKEHYRELARTQDVQKQPAAFRKLLAEAERNAEQLERALRSWEKAGRSRPAPEAVRASFSNASKNCTACHQQFRDVPLGEKQR
jgi:protein tyrosine phosphatase (PTP) superfamily phosphohydrolase (DUF442 family)